MATDIRVPALGESVTEATIGQWFKKVGDTVAADEPVVELETDKVTIEVPAPAAGVLEAISAQPGDTVNVGSLIGAIGEGAAAAAPKAEAPKPAPAPAPAAAPQPVAAAAAPAPARNGAAPTPAPAVAPCTWATPSSSTTLRPTRAGSMSARQRCRLALLLPGRCRSVHRAGTSLACSRCSIDSRACPWKKNSISLTTSRTWRATSG